MTYFLEYTVPAPEEDGEYAFPVSEKHDGYTVPLSETGAEIVHSPDLPARSSITAASIEEAQTEAEEIIRHSKADSGQLFDDPTNSSQAGSGKLISRFTPSGGWEVTTTPPSQ